MTKNCSPTSLTNALEALVAGVRVVNGGTDVMVAVNDGRDHVAAWLSLRKVKELQEISTIPQGLRIGAGVTFATIEHKLVKIAPALAMAAATVGSRQIRNVATIGGNVATASPAGDSLLPLLTYDAEVELASINGTRSLPLAKFILGPKKTVISDNELITAIVLRDTRGPQHFAKVGTRNAMVVSICSLAARLDLINGSARVAVGSVAPTPLAVNSAEPFLLERTAGHEFASSISSAISPISDHRASAEYRRHAIFVLAERTHRQLWSSV